MDFSEETLLPRRPYLLRAIYQWLIDNGLTPLVLVDATSVGVSVPMKYVKSGKIVLNIAPYSIGNCDMNNEGLEFNARFDGSLEHLYIPMAAIEAIYARENAAGLSFSPEPHYLQNQSNSDNKTKPNFRIIK